MPRSRCKWLCIGGLVFKKDTVDKCGDSKDTSAIISFWAASQCERVRSYVISRSTWRSAMQACRVSTGLLLLIGLTATNWPRLRRPGSLARGDCGRRHGLAEKKHDEAIRLASEAISISPDQPGGYVIRTRAYSAAGKLAEAIADLDHLIGISPKSFSLFGGPRDREVQAAKVQRGDRGF